VCVGDVGGSPCRVMVWFPCEKEMEGIQKSACRGPSVRNHSIPRTTSVPTIGKR